MSKMFNIYNIYIFIYINLYRGESGSLVFISPKQASPQKKKKTEWEFTLSLLLISEPHPTSSIRQHFRQYKQLIVEVRVDRGRCGVRTRLHTYLLCEKPYTQSLICWWKYVIFFAVIFPDAFTRHGPGICNSYGTCSIFFWKFADLIMYDAFRIVV